MKNFNYNEKFLHILRTLVPITDSVKIKKEGADVVVNNETNDRSISYSLKTKLENFNLPEEINFLSFTKFFDLYNLTKAGQDIQPQIGIDSDNIHIQVGDRHVTERMANPGAIRDVKLVDLNAIPFISALKLNLSDLQYMKQCINTIHANFIRFHLVNDKVNVTVYDTINATKGEYTYDLANPVKESRDYVTSTECFSSLPNYDYSLCFLENPAILAKKDNSDGFELNIALSLTE
jgi:hypothetical protein